jgi:hypothetical protein
MSHQFSSRFQKRFPVLAAMVMGRNVANVPDVETFLKGLHTNQYAEVDRWLDTTMRKWLLRAYEKFNPYKPKSSDPDWMQGKTDLIELTLDQDLAGRVEHVVDFLKAKAEENPEIKLNNFQADEAFKQSNEWLENLMKKKIEEEVENTDYQVLSTDGAYRWCKLISENALLREGRLMGHCVGGYWKQVKRGTVEIISLRDSKNEPHATIEFIPKQGVINQIKGKGNKGLVDEYRPYLVRFLNDRKLNWKKISSWDANLNGILIGGKKGSLQIYDKKNIPNGTVLVGDVSSYGDPITMPATLTIKGSFTPVKGQDLPSERLEVTGVLELTETKANYGTLDLPNELIVRGNFIASNIGIEKLPAKHYFGGSVFLDNSDIISLPDGLKVRGELDVSNTRLRSLPNKLKVGGELDIMDTSITVIPEDAVLGDSIYVDDETQMDIPEKFKEQVYG